MHFHLGIKSDPIEYRYTYEWLFDLCAETGLTKVQLGSFFELYSVDLSYFADMRAQAKARGVDITSCFTAHRELGGFFTGDERLVAVARRSFERYIDVAATVGAAYVGSNPGAIYRDRMDSKQAGIDCYLAHMRELMHYARDKGVSGLTFEPMSSLAEPPSTPDEVTHLFDVCDAYHREHPDTTVPVYACGDISHGVADNDQRIVHGNVELFEMEIPMMAEFHFKNTDAVFNSTFGFSEEECRRGIVDLDEMARLIERNAEKWPVDDVVGYLEIGGPKTGRDYTDPHLRSMLCDSIHALQEAMAGVMHTSGATHG